MPGDQHIHIREGILFQQDAFSEGGAVAGNENGAAVPFIKHAQAVFIAILYHWRRKDRNRAAADTKGEIFCDPEDIFDTFRRQIRKGFRLGYGAGHYDRWLSDYTGHTVGMCREISLQDEVPTEAHDKPVQIVVTEHEVLTF